MKCDQQLQKLQCVTPWYSWLNTARPPMVQYCPAYVHAYKVHTVDHASIPAALCSKSTYSMSSTMRWVKDSGSLKYTGIVTRDRSRPKTCLRKLGQ